MDYGRLNLLGRILLGRILLGRIFSVPILLYASL